MTADRQSSRAGGRGVHEDLGDVGDRLADGVVERVGHLLDLVAAQVVLQVDAGRDEQRVGPEDQGEQLQQPRDAVVALDDLLDPGALARGGRRAARRGAVARAIQAATAISSTPTRIEAAESNALEPVSWCSPMPAAAMPTPASAA